MEDLNPRILAAIRKQLAKLVAEPPEGIYPTINEDNWAQVQATISGPTGTPYEHGIFFCKLEIPSDFPKSPPKGYFLTKIFHPNISPGGEICVNTLKRDWNPAAWSISHIFSVIRCLLIEPFPESALNEEAGRMFMENWQSYFHQAQLYTNVHAVPKKEIQPESGQIDRGSTYDLKRWLRRIQLQLK